MFLLLSFFLLLCSLLWLKVGMISSFFRLCLLTDVLLSSYLRQIHILKSPEPIEQPHLHTSLISGIQKSKTNKRTSEICLALLLAGWSPAKA